MSVGNGEMTRCSRVDISRPCGQKHLTDFKNFRQQTKEKKLMNVQQHEHKKRIQKIGWHDLIRCPKVTFIMKIPVEKAYIPLQTAFGRSDRLFQWSELPLGNELVLTSRKSLSSIFKPVIPGWKGSDECWDDHWASSRLKVSIGGSRGRGTWPCPPKQTINKTQTQCYVRVEHAKKKLVTITTLKIILLHS